MRSCCFDGLRVAKQHSFCSLMSAPTHHFSSNIGPVVLFITHMHTHTHERERQCKQEQKEIPLTNKGDYQDTKIRCSQTQHQKLSKMIFQFSPALPFKSLQVAMRVSGQGTWAFGHQWRPLHSATLCNRPHNILEEYFCFVVDLWRSRTPKKFHKK